MFYYEKEILQYIQGMQTRSVRMEVKDFYKHLFQPKPMEKRPFSRSQTSMFGLRTRALVSVGYIPESRVLKLYGG